MSTETPFETREITGVAPPKCRLCGGFLTSTEFDTEPGPAAPEDRFYSAHSRCYAESPAGRFIVVSVDDSHRTLARYELRTAASEKAASFASSNPGRRFSVLDLTDDSLVAQTVETWVLGDDFEPTKVSS